MKKSLNYTFLNLSCLIILGIIGVLLLSTFLLPVSRILMGFLEKFSDGDLNVSHWTNILNLFALKFLFFDILLFILVFIKHRNQVSLKDSFEALTDLINRMSRPTQILLAFTLILFFHSFISLNSFDDAWFKEQLQNTTILSFVGGRYFTWSSRFFIEILMLGSFSVNDGIWRIMDSIAFVVIAESFIKLVVPEDKKRYSFIAYILILFLPILCLSSCGWGAVTCNYLWPCAEILPVFVIMKKIYKKEKIQVWQFILTIITAILACNQEQMAVLVFGITLVLLVYRICIKEVAFKYTWFFVVMILISSASLLFILTCPGNSFRYEDELLRNFPEYASLSIFTKILMTIPIEFSYFFGIGKPNMVVIPLLLAITIISFAGNHNKLKPFVLILDLFVLVFGLCGFVLSRFIHFFIFQNEYLYPYAGISFSVSLVEISIFILLAVILTIAVFRCSRDRIHGYLNVMLLAAGYCSAAIQAFSPTVYEVSQGRMIFFTMIIILYISFDLLISTFNIRRKSK